MHEKRYNGKVDKLRSGNRLTMLEVERVVSLALTEIKASSMLDVGIGSGVFAEAFQERGLKVAGVDVSQDSLDAAAAYLPGVELRQGTAEALPFDDAFCDLVCMGLLLHETDAPLAALKEAFRVGRQRTVVLEWCYDADQDFGPPLDHRVSEVMIREWAEQAGYKKIIKHELTYLVLYVLDAA